MLSRIHFATVSILTVLPFVVGAPSMPNYNIVWASDFNGAAGSAPDSSQWQHYTGPNYNGELSTYTTSTSNARLSGNGSLIIAPQHSGSDPNSGWTSARLETKQSFTCDSGHRMVVQAEIKLGNNIITHEKGLWPAFWAKGESSRSGTPWPECGEWDIMETKNGGDTMWTTIHVGVGDKNDNPQAHIGTSFVFEYEAYHTWAFKVDRTASTWEEQNVKWYMDGQQVFQVTGAQVGNYDEWVNLARSPFYLILNVAVGGGCPGGGDTGDCTPNSNTLGGDGSGMEVRYVAVYKST